MKYLIINEDYSLEYTDDAQLASIIGAYSPVINLETRSILGTDKFVEETKLKAEEFVNAKDGELGSSDLFERRESFPPAELAGENNFVKVDKSDET